MNKKREERIKKKKKLENRKKNNTFNYPGRKLTVFCSFKRKNFLQK